jgi:phage gpG-like protein
LLNIEVKVPKKTRKLFDDLQKEYKEGLVAGLNRAVKEQERITKKRFGKPGHLKVKTGALRRSIKSDVKKSGLEGWVGTDIVYGAIHQYGGVINASPGKFLVFEGKKGLVRTKQVVIPKRPFLITNKSHAARVISEELLKRLNGA